MTPESAVAYARMDPQQEVYIDSSSRFSDFDIPSVADESSLANEGYSSNVYTLNALSYANTKQKVLAQLEALRQEAVDCELEAPSDLCVKLCAEILSIMRKQDLNPSHVTVDGDGGFVILFTAGDMTFEFDVENTLQCRYLEFRGERLVRQFHFPR